MWLGPPCMKRKMTCLAWAVKCGGLAVSGLAAEAGNGAAEACRLVEMSPSRVNKSRSAHEPNPRPAWRRISRRERGEIDGEHVGQRGIFVFSRCAQTRWC